MRKEVSDLLDDRVLASAAAQYGLDRTALTSLNGNVNFVYEYEADSKAYILRLTHCSRRELLEVTAEAHFVQYLAEQGVSVSRVIPSLNGKVAERTENGFSAVLFEKAEGRLPLPEDWNPALFYNWGKLTGQLHAQSRTYTPDPLYKRREWHEEEWMKFETYIPSEQTKVLKRAHDLIGRLHSLPKDREVYGLVHSDLHLRNFFIHNGTLTVFDFDDCCYNWFANDIATILYHVLTRLSKPPGRAPGEREYLETFLKHFMKGYRTEHQWDAAWWHIVPDFLKLRRLLIYVYYYQEHDLANLSEERLKVLEQTRRDIEDDFPVTRICFADWCEGRT
jgi:Ser/Thr protein kinase RdoA (MazF antagonist)